MNTSPRVTLAFALVAACTLSLPAQPTIVVANTPAAGLQPSYDFGPATFSAFRGEGVTAPNAAINSANTTFLAVAGGANVNATDDADGILGGADQERQRIAIDPGYALDRFTYQWTHADGPLATDGVNISGFLSDPGAVFSGGLGALPPIYNGGTLTFRVSTFNADVQSVSFTNPAATTGATLEVTVSDSTQANPQFAMTSATFVAPASTIFASGFDGNAAPVATADGTSGALSLTVPWIKAATVTAISGLTAISTGDSGTVGGFIQLSGSPYLANSNNVFLSRNLNADTNNATTQRGFSLAFTVNSPIHLRSLVVLAGHATASGGDEGSTSTLAFQLSGGTLGTPVTGSSVRDYTINPPHHTVAFNLSGTTIGAGSYALAVYETSLVGAGAFAIYDGIALYAATTVPVPGAMTLVAVRNQATNLPAATLVSAGNDPDGDPMNVTGVSAPSLGGGTVSLSAGMITYTPATNYTGADEFTYTLSDDRGGNATGTVQVPVVTDAANYNLLSPPSFIAGGNTTLNFSGIPNYQYALDRTTNLNAPIGWMPVITNTAGTNGFLTFTNTSSSPQNYFRARYVLTPSQAVETQINGDFWFDMSGTKVDATEMSITQVGSYFYAFGSKRLLPPPSTYYHEIFQEFRCYRSTNLRDWEFRGTVLTAADIGLGDTYSARCKVIYNAATDQYVMWCKLKDSNNDRAMGVATCPTVDGQYTYLGKRYGTNSQGTVSQSGDMSVFQEGTNAYVVYSDVATRDLVINKLTSDYLNIASYTSTVIGTLEAPMLFKVGNRYFCVGSGVTGWNANQSKYSSSSSITGGWSALANFGNTTTYDSQGSDTVVVNGTQATIAIVCADRWELPYLGNTTSVWLPITINGSTASIKYMDSFIIDASTGVWSAGPPHYYKIINKNSGKALSMIAADAAGNPLSRTSNGADIVQWTYEDNEDWSKWWIEGTPDGYKKIINKYSGKAMRVFDLRQDGFTPFSATSDTADICQFDYSEDDTLKWKAQELGNGNGHRSVINKFAGKAAAVFSADAGGNPIPVTADGADVAQYTFNGSQDWHLWQFILLP